MARKAARVREIAGLLRKAIDTADTSVCAIRHGDGAGTRPVPGQAEERSFGTGLRLGLRRNKQNCRREQCRLEAVPGKFQKKACQEFHLLTRRIDYYKTATAAPPF